MSNVVLVQALKDIALLKPMKKGEQRSIPKPAARVLYAMKLISVVVPKKAKQ